MSVKEDKLPVIKVNSTRDLNTKVIIVNNIVLYTGKLTQWSLYDICLSNKHIVYLKRIQDFMVFTSETSNKC